VSDFQKALKGQARKPWVKQAEAGEQAEGVRDALKAGRGDVKAGAKKLRLRKEGLPAQLKRARTCPCPGKKEK